MENYIEQEWKPEYDSDRELVSLCHQLSHVISAYNQMVKECQDAEDYSSSEHDAEGRLWEKSESYLQKISNLDAAFDQRRRELGFRH